MKLVLLLLSLAALISAIPCESASLSKLSCEYPTDSLSNCTLGEHYTASCKVSSSYECDGPRQFDKDYICQPCFFTDPDLCNCKLDSSHANCRVDDPEEVLYHCTVPDNMICISDEEGRSFSLYLQCSRPFEYSRTTVSWMSLFFGGFGIDRIYLGHTVSGIAKGVTLGGLGVWTALDFILILVGYLRPADGSGF
ncbi:hypothetical protein P9112_007432 [Eukaryota sp. TZLM1-RC]